MRVTGKSYQSKLKEFIRQYQEEVGRPVTLHEVGEWALKNGYWKPPTKYSPLDILVRDLRQAGAMAHFEDENGIQVRKWITRKVKVKLQTGEEIQQTFWDDIQTSPIKFIHAGLQQKRFLSLCDLRQIYNQYNYVNKHHQDEPISMSFDFTEDLEELSQPTEYPGMKTEDENLGTDEEE